MTAPSGYGAEFDEFIRHTREADVASMIEGSAVVMSILPSGEPDLKWCVEMGLAIWFDKPIIVIAANLDAVPAGVVRIADRMIEADLDTEAGRAAAAEQIRQAVDEEAS